MEDNGPLHHDSDLVARDGSLSQGTYPAGRKDEHLWIYAELLDRERGRDGHKDKNKVVIATL